MPSWKSRHVDTNPSPPNPASRLWTWFFWAISTKVRWCVELNLWGHDDLRLEAVSDKQRGISAIQATASQSFAPIDCRYAIAEVPKPFETAVPSWLVWQRSECWVARRWVDLKDMGNWDYKETRETLEFDHGVLLMCCISESSNFHERFCRGSHAEVWARPKSSYDAGIEKWGDRSSPQSQMAEVPEANTVKLGNSEVSALLSVWCKRRESWGVGDGIFAIFGNAIYIGGTVVCFCWLQ